MTRYEIITDIDLEAGGTLKNAHVVFHTSEHRQGKVIWICHALTANSNPEDWWPEMVGPGKPIDTDKNFVVCVNKLGSPYGSESPASTNPATGKPWLLDFPRITVRDLITAMIAVRKHLGINEIDLLIGSSTGGFQALEWAITEPDLFRRADGSGRGQYTSSRKSLTRWKVMRFPLWASRQSASPDRLTIKRSSPSTVMLP